MNEMKGNIWDEYEKGKIVCVTTNGVINKKGECVMGAGIAKDAKFLFPELPKQLGKLIRKTGNRLYYFDDIKVFTFPTKHHWRENSDIDLIKKSLMELNNYMAIHNITNVVLPRPGCANGQLDWEFVKNEIEPILNKDITIIYK